MTKKPKEEELGVTGIDIFISLTDGNKRQVTLDKELQGIIFSMLLNLFTKGIPTDPINVLNLKIQPTNKNNN